jgi:hypothetical protein
MKVTVLAREIQAPYKYIDPTWDGKKLVPYSGQFYLRFSRHGKQMITPAGNDPGDVLRQREIMLATLPAEKAGLVVNGGIATLTMPTPIAAAPKVTIQEKIDAYLDDLRRAKRPAGTISDKQLHLRLFERAPEIVLMRTLFLKRTSDKALSASLGRNPPTDRG